jgi:hypothetical protein
MIKRFCGAGKFGRLLLLFVHSLSISKGEKKQGEKVYRNAASSVNLLL